MLHRQQQKRSLAGLLLRGSFSAIKKSPVTFSGQLLARWKGREKFSTQIGIEGSIFLDLSKKIESSSRVFAGVTVHRPDDGVVHFVKWTPVRQVAYVSVLGLKQRPSTMEEGNVTLCQFATRGPGVRRAAHVCGRLYEP